MKIDILTNANIEPNGSFTGVTSKTIWGDSFRIGVGGAELGLLTMCEEWQKVGYDVTLYNNPWERNASSFEQKFVSEFDPSEDRDVLINFRSPVIQSVPAKGLRIWWSTDQFSVGDYAKFAGFVDKIVCISSHHSEYFAHTYGIENCVVIDLPVRSDDFKSSVEKVPHRFIFSSVPDRGLQNLWRMWDKVKRGIPDASLVITSDYRLWGTSSLNEKHRVMWMEKKGFEFLGAVNRARYIEELQKAEILFYPCNYEELFCISCAEAQFAGLIPVTSSIGSLSTTNMGYKVELDANDQRNDDAFIARLMLAVLDPGYKKLGKEFADKAKERFSPEKILKEWEDKVFK